MYLLNISYINNNAGSLLSWWSLVSEYSFFSFALDRTRPEGQ